MPAPLREITVQSLDELLEASAATPQFKQAVRDLAAGRPQGLVRYNAGGPPIKVLRLVSKLLEAYSEIALVQVEVEAESGCSDYVGLATVQPGGARFEFEWNCAWRAQELGWTDAFGDPDQARVVRTLGYQCFRRFEKI